MMRRPYTPPRDPPPGRRIDRPEPGHWLVRLVRGGPLVPARIFWAQTTHEPGNPENLMERSPFLAAEVGGDVVEVDSVWHRRGTPITEAEYRYRLAEMQWATEHAPAEAIAKPRQPVDFTAIPLPF